MRTRANDVPTAHRSRTTRAVALALAAVALVPASAVAAGYRDEVISDNPAAYWRLGEASGTVAANEIAANTGTYTGGVLVGQQSALSGDTNTAATFDGVNDHIVVPQSTTLDATAGVTVELWAKRTKNASWQVLVGKPGNGQSQLENYAIWFDSSNRLQAYFGNGTTHVSAAWGTAVDTGWHHIAATYDNAVARLYVDGVQRAQTSSTVQLTPSANALNIGRSNDGSYFFGGSLDDVAVYRTVLSATRIQAHFAAASTPTVDTTAPLLTLTQPVGGSTTASATPAVSGVAGTASGDSTSVTVRLYAGSSATGAPVQTLSATRAGGGAYSVTATTLANGVYTAQAEQADTAGNVGRSGAATFTVAVGSGDVTAPVVSLTQPANGSSTTATTPTFSGVAGTLIGDSTAVTVRLYAGATATGPPVQSLTATRSIVGAYSVPASPALANGTYTARAEQLDDSGNVGQSASTSFTVDTVAPAVTLTQPAAAATVGTAPTLAGVAGTATGDSATVTVLVYSGSTTTGTLVRTLSATRQTGGAYSVAATPALAGGTYTARAQQSDQASNGGQSAATTFTVDATAPVVTLTAPAAGSTLTIATPAVSGVAGTATGDSAAVTVRIYSGSSATGPALQTLNATRQTGGAYTVNAATLGNGTYTARASQADAVGNVGDSAANTFTVAVPSGTDPVLIGAGDIAGCGSTPKDAETAALLAQHPTATVFTLGDNAYDNGTATEYANCYGPTWGVHKARTHPTVADHDLDTGTPQAYLNYFNAQLAPYGPTATDPTKMYYSYNLGAWHVVHLNAVCFYYTPGCNVAGQEAWFQADLAAHPNQCTVVMMSSPRFSSGNIHGNNTDMQGLWATAYEGGAELVLSGDDHIYERFAPMDAGGNADPAFGVRQFIAGTGGYLMYGIGTVKPNSQVRYTANAGVMKLTLHPTSYDWQFIPIDGLPSPDSGTANCHGVPGSGGGVTGAPTVRASSTATANYASAALAVNKPAGTAAGDVLVATIAHQGGSIRTLTAPAGWTAVPNADATDGSNVRTRAFSRVAGAAEPASYTFTLTGGSGMALSGGILAITGADTTNPINAAAAQATATNVTNLVAPSVTTTVAKTLLVYAGGVNSPLTYTAPSGMSERWDVTTSGAYNAATMTATGGFAGPGATGTRTGILSQSARGAALLIAIAPAP